VKRQTEYVNFEACPKIRHCIFHVSPFTFHDCLKLHTTVDAGGTPYRWEGSKTENKPEDLPVAFASTSFRVKGRDEISLFCIRPFHFLFWLHL
jgi:hypothetical protein